MPANAKYDNIAFGGNPNVTISAISVAGGIDCSRTSGTTPCFIQCSASAITATGTSRPYEDLEYVWTAEASDGGGGWEAVTDSESLTSAVTGNSVNSYTDQTGPEAVFVFRDADTYRITLDIRGKNGGSFTTNSTTQQITVTAFSPGAEMWFDADLGDDANAGTEVSPKQTGTAIRTFLSGNDNRTAHLKRGGVFEVDNHIVCNTWSDIRIDAYGSGDRPVLQDSASWAGTSAPLRWATSDPGNASSNVVISDLVLNNANSGLSSLIEVSGSGTTGSFDDVYFDNVGTASGSNLTADCILMNLAPRWTTTGVGFWNCDFLASTSDGQGMFNSNGGSKSDTQSWIFVVGGSFRGTSQSATLDHHWYPNNWDHGLARWIDFGTSTSRNYCINTNCASGTASEEVSNYWLVAECNVSATLQGVDFSNSNNNRDGVFADVVIERNAVNGLGLSVASQGKGVFCFSCIAMTIRDNLFWDNDLEDITTTHTGVPFVYRNNIYAPSGKVGGQCIEINASTANGFAVTNNAIHDARTAASVLEANNYSGWDSSETFDTNTYYTPSDSDSDIISDTGGGNPAMSFAEWQAAGFDAAGSTSDPGWVDPANGDFRTNVSPTGAWLLI